jgi:DNA-binding Xre family transcriptional regulator
MSRQVSYRWRLRKAMADADMFTSTALTGPLAERGVTLSASQVHRLVTGTPERLNMTVLAALCDILHVSPADLITVDAADAAAAAVAGTGTGTGAGTGSPVPGLAPPRPRHVTLEP